MRRVLQAIGALLVLSSCGTPIEYLSPGTTFGEITIGKPRLSTRERLINDRLEEEAWLRIQLRDTDNKQFGFQGKSDVRSFTGITGSVGVKADAAQIQLYREQAAQQLEDLKRDRELKAIDYQIALAKKQKDLAAAAADPASASASYYNSLARGTLPTTSASAPTAPSDFSGRLDDLAKSISAANTQIATLSARSDQNSKPTAADVVATPIEEFRERLSYREEVRNEWISNALDDAHDLRGNTLYRLSFDTTVVPGNDTSAWAVIVAKVQNSKDSNLAPEDFAVIVNERIDREVQDIYGAVLFACNDVTERKRLVECIQHLAPSTLALLGEWSSRGPEAGLFRSFSFSRDIRGVVTPADAVRMVDKLLGLANVSVPGAPASAPSGGSGKPDGKLLAAGAANLARTSLIEMLVPSFDSRDVPYQQSRKACLVNSRKRLLGFSVEDEKVQVTSPSGAGYELAKITVLNEVRNQGIRNPNLILPPDDDQRKCLEAYVDSLRDELVTALKAESGSVFAYSATPKESVQRISEVLSRREVNQFALALQAVTGAAAFDAFLSYMRANDALFHSLRRQPLVVGFVGSPSDANFKSFYSATATFGWAIGPKYEIRYSGRQQQAGFRHVPMQNGVSAVVSVPKSWRRMEIVVKTCWKAEPNAYVSCSDAPPQVVSLPGDLSRAFDLYRGSEARRQISLVHNRPDVYKVRPGGSADFVIRGDNLWRNTSVMLGGQEADRISVIPDMGGIVAHFERLNPPTVQRGALGSRSELSVATSEDFAKVADVVFDDESRPADASWSLSGERRVIVPGATLDLAPNGRLPESFYSLVVTMRNLDKAVGSLAQSESVELLLSSNIARAKIPSALPSWTSGNRAEIGVLLKRSPGDAVAETRRAGVAVFYATDADSQAAYEDKLQRDVHTLTLKLPESFGDAYPALANRSSFPINISTKATSDAEPKVQSRICDLTATKQRRSCTVTLTAAGPVTAVTLGEGEGVPIARAAAQK